MINDFINGFLKMILDFVIYIVNLILIPIDAIIDTLFPDISSAFSYIASALNVGFQYVGYFFDMLGLESFTILFLTEYVIFRLTLPLQLWVIKLAVNVYNKLKP